MKKNTGNRVQLPSLFDYRLFLCPIAVMQILFTFEEPYSYHKTSQGYWVLRFFGFRIFVWQATGPIKG